MKRNADEKDVKWLIKVQADLLGRENELDRIINGFFEIFDKKQVSPILFILLEKETTRNKRGIIKILSFIENEKLLPILTHYLKITKTKKKLNYSEYRSESWEISLLRCEVIDALARMQYRKADLILLEELRKSHYSDHIYFIFSNVYNFEIKTKELLQEFAEIAQSTNKKEIRMQYVSYVKKHKLKDHEQNLLILLKKEQSEDVIVQILLTLLHFRSKKNMQAIFDNFIKITSDIKKRSVIRILRLLNIEESYSVLLHYLDPINTRYIRCAAIDGLRNLKAKKSIEPLHLMIQYDPDCYVKAYALRAIRAIMKNKLSKLYIELLQMHNCEKVRVEAVKCIRKLPPELALQVLMKSYKEDTNLKVKYAILEALAKIGDENAFKIVSNEFLNSQNGKIRGYIGILLGRKWKNKASNLLILALEKEDDLWATKCYIKILARINTKEIISKLEEILLKSDNINIRREIVWALGNMRIKEVLPTIMKVFVEDVSYPVRRAAASALLKIDVEEGVQMVRERNGKDPDNPTNYYIRRKLKKYDEIYKDGHRLGLL